MKTYPTIGIWTSHDCYDVDYATKRTMTVGELIAELENYDEESKVVFVNDNGYTFGYIDEGKIGVWEND